MKGKIIKGIAGFYYVETPENGTYECRAKGIFRKEGQKPLVGDEVEISVISETEKTGNVDVICPRRSVLIRPAVANIDQALVVFAVSRPKPNLNLLDRFLVSMDRQSVSCLICFNKQDTAEEGELERLSKIYEKSGSRVFFTSAAREQGISELREALEGKTTAVAGPSGVGKSSLVNLLAPNAGMETGEISSKIDRGRHTTRHSQIFRIGKDSFLFDTPGFSSLMVWDMEKEELKDCFPEFAPYEGCCRFQGCTHTDEPGCRVKEACQDGEISGIRYKNYLEMYQELKNKRRY